MKALVTILNEGSGHDPNRRCEPASFPALHGLTAECGGLSAELGQKREPT